LIYFGENKDYIMCECEVCKREIYAERNSITEEDAYSYHLESPLKCQCGNIDEYINRAKKACYHIRQELQSLSDLLHQQHDAHARISTINAEINKKFNSPTFLQALLRDFLFALKIFFYMIIGLLGLQLFLFLVTVIMFFSGMLLDMPDLSSSGNQLFYNLNIFKDRGGGVLSFFGMPAEYEAFNTELASEQLVLNYIPYAIAGSIVMIFYVFLIIFVVRAAINVYKLVFFAGKVMNQKIRVLQRREAYERELKELKHEAVTLQTNIDAFDILGSDYKNLKATDSILGYFTNNRVDTIREAINLYHDDDFRNKQLDYSKALYAEIRQTRRYTKAMYMLSSDPKSNVEVRDEQPPSVVASTPVNQSYSAGSSKITANSSASSKPKREKRREEREDEQEREPIFAKLGGAIKKIKLPTREDKDNDTDKKEDRTSKTNPPKSKPQSQSNRYADTLANANDNDADNAERTNKSSEAPKPKPTNVNKSSDSEKKSAQPKKPQPKPKPKSEILSEIFEDLE